jgi:hypothetical protein
LSINQFNQGRRAFWEICLTDRRISQQQQKKIQTEKKKKKKQNVQGFIGQKKKKLIGIKM